MFSHDAGYEFFQPGSRVKKVPDPGSGSATRKLSIFNPKKLILSSRKYDPGCLFRITDPRSQIWIFATPDPAAKKASDPGSLIFVDWIRIQRAKK
jgi:hypothetical protein